MATRAARGFGQYSGAARALERVGDRWALLIVRDLLVGARRYGDLKAGLPRIPTNILSDRLRELQESGVIRRVPTVRGGYELTTFGRALEPVVVALERWGWSALGEPAEGEIVTADALTASHCVRRSGRMSRRARLRPSTCCTWPTRSASVAGVVGGPQALEVVRDRAGRRNATLPHRTGALPQPRRGTGPRWRSRRAPNWCSAGGVP